MLNSTAIPTNTVEARKAWLRMEEKFTRLPMHFKVGSDTIPSITDELELKNRKKRLNLLFKVVTIGHLWQYGFSSFQVGV